MEPTKQAEDSWVDLVAGSVRSGVGGPDCTPGYYNNEGQPLNDSSRRAMAGYPGGAVAYFAYIDAWRSTGDFKGLEFR